MPATADSRRPLITFWKFNTATAAGDVISLVLGVGRKQSTPTPAQRWRPWMLSDLQAFLIKKNLLIARWNSCLSIGRPGSHSAPAIMELARCLCKLSILLVATTFLPTSTFYRSTTRQKRISDFWMRWMLWKRN